MATKDNLSLARAAYRSAACSSEARATIKTSLNASINSETDAYFAPDFKTHRPPPGISPNIEGTKEWNAAIVKAFPDYDVTIDDQFAQDDKVVTRWTARGTHKGEFLGIPPTGKQATVSGITISRYANGKIAESWFEWDTLDVMKQLGADPSGKGGLEVAEGVTLNITINRA